MMCSKVSIITPCFNSAKTIRRTIESVLNQTYPNIEYIIIDGGSTDGTLSIIEEYSALFHGRLRYISERDRGIYDAMNKGIKMSTGCLIGILNSDDYYEHETVARCIGRYIQGGDQVIYGYMRVLNRDRTIKICKDSHKALCQYMIPHPTCFVSRTVYKKYGLFLKAFKVTADYEFMLRVYNKGVEFIQIPEILTNFRIGGASSNRRTLIEKETIRLMYNCISFKEYMVKMIEYSLGR